MRRKTLTPNEAAAAAAANAGNNGGAAGSRRVSIQEEIRRRSVQLKERIASVAASPAHSPTPPPVANSPDHGRGGQGS